MEAEVPHPHLPAEGAHNLLPILIRPFHKPLGFAAPVPTPKNPGLGLITVLMPFIKHIKELGGHGDFLAVAAGQVVRFQAAYVSQAEIEQVVAQMSSAPRRWDVVNGRPSLLRQAVALVAR